MSRIVRAYIQPIKAKDINVPKLHMDRDNTNPLTRALADRIPQLNLEDLQALRDHMMTHSERDSITRREDVKSWVAMIDNEIHSRHYDSKDALVSLINTFALD